MLGHPEPVAVEDAHIDRVPEIGERLEESAEHCTVVPRRKVGHVLDEDRVGPEAIDDLHERTPEQRPRILRMTLAGSNLLAELRLPSPGEWLTRDATSYQLYMLDAPPVKLLEQLPGVAEVTHISETTKVRRVGLDGPSVGIGANEHGEAGITETEG